MLKNDFLLEIGIEEIPAGFIANSNLFLKDFFVNLLKKEKLSYDKLEQFSTPRRLAIRIEGLISKQVDEVIERVGPASRIAFGENGGLSKAGLGFLRGAGASESDLYTVKTDKGEYIAVKLHIKGKETVQILEKNIELLINKFVFPKSMKWGDNKLLFARPLRSIVALFGDKLLNCEISRVNAGVVSFGNRFMGLENSISITEPLLYEDNLRKIGVIVNREERKSIISKQITDLFADSSNHVLEDKMLLETVTDLVEFPTSIIGEFDPKYLMLPSKIITSTLTQHQKYFAVVDSDENLTNKFVFVGNGNPEFSDIIRQGNEKVIKARLEDAEFFYKEDTKVSFENYVTKLKDVLFQAKLGSLFEKTNRIVKIVDYLCDKLDFSEEEKKYALRAAHLCKADLVTLMLGEKEFTKLQGYMGQKYCQASGEHDLVSKAVYEHYMPRGKNDGLPSNRISAIIAIADKVDTVCGIAGIGMLPSGSNDPFALRRAANGVVQIIEDQKFSIDFIDMIDFCFQILEDKLKDFQNKDFVQNFFKQRVKWLLQLSNIDYDVIESVMHINFSDITDLKSRALALQSYKYKEDFIKLVLGFKRVSNIIAKSNIAGEPDSEVLIEPAEKKLFDEYLTLTGKIGSLLDSKSYSEILGYLTGMSKFIDAFFDDVLVNADDEQLRFNRHCLLYQIRKLFLRIADIAKIVVEGEK